MSDSSQRTFYLLRALNDFKPYGVISYVVRNHNFSLKSEWALTLYGQNVEFVNVKPGGTFSDHWGLKTVQILVRVTQVLTISIYIKCRIQANFAMLSTIIACSSLVSRDSNKVI
jgi:hypothetical protein